VEPKRGFTLKRKRKLMIVDDEIDVVRVLKIYLEKKGFQVDTFTDANMALRHFRNEFSTFNAHPLT
jgi:DNA-binding response OmpR family regulator